MTKEALEAQYDQFHRELDIKDGSTQQSNGSLERSSKQRLDGFRKVTFQKPQTSCCTFSTWKRPRHAVATTLLMLSYITLFNSLRLSAAFICRTSSVIRRAPFFQRITHRDSDVKQFLTNEHLLSPLCNYNSYRPCTSIQARKKTVTPERVEPLKSTDRNQVKKRKKVDQSSLSFENEALVAAIAVSNERSDSAASIYSSTDQSQMNTKRLKGRPVSVAGAMNKSTMMNNIEAAAIADEMIANGMVLPSSKTNLIEIAQEKKRVADRKKYYEDVSEDQNDISSLFYEQVQEMEHPAKKTRSRKRAKSQIQGSARIQPQKKRRGRPRKNQSMETDSVMEQVTSNNEVRRIKMQQNTASESPQEQSGKANSKKMGSNKTKQVRKRDTNNTPGKLKGDRLNLQQYYNTELLTAPEEYSLGKKVQFLMKCEDVYHGLTEKMMRNPTIGEWAYACGFKEHDDISEVDYVESRLESSIRPVPLDNSPVKIVRKEDEGIKGAKFVGNGLENENGVGRGRGRARKELPLQLKDWYDDSLIKYPSLENDEAEQPVYKSYKLNKDGKQELIPINRGTPRQFIEMILTSKESKQRMVECNMRLVVSIARRYHNVGVNTQDLVQEGSLGLFRAAEKFDPSKGYKFSTYASWWIQQAVFRSIAYHSRTIRLPVHVHNLLNRTRRAKTTLKQELGRSPTNEELAEQLDMTPEKFSKMIRLTKRTISLEKPKYKNNPKDLGHESDATLGDTIDSSSTVKDDSSPEQTVDQGLFQDDLKDMLQILGEDEKRVISARYGLNDGLTRTVSAVAVQLRKSKSWVRSQECRALRKLRRPWYEQRLKEHQNSLTGGSR